MTDVSHNAVLPLETGGAGGPASVYFTDQLLIEPEGASGFAAKGDSGSIIVAGDGNGVAGLLCGGDPSPAGRWALANRISNVLQALSIALA